MADPVCALSAKHLQSPESAGLTHRSCLSARSTCSVETWQDAFRAKVAEKFPSKADPAYPYSEVLHKSFLFYFQQRSGKLPHQVCPHAHALSPFHLLRQP